MGMHFSPRIDSLDLIFTGFHHLGLIRNCSIAKRSCFSSLFNNAASASALVLEDYVSDFVPSSEIVVNPSPSYCERISVFPVAVRVLHTLDWNVATEIRFSGAVMDYGIHHSVDVFRVIVDVFASAPMEREVYLLLWDVVESFREANLNVVDLLGSLNYVDGSVCVFDVLARVCAMDSMLENALEEFIRGQNIGRLLGNKSCNFLLKCLTEANEGVLVENLFGAMKESGPIPNLFTYTMMMRFYCKGYLRKGEVNILKATEIFDEMINVGLRPTVVTYGVYIDGLCRAGLVESASDFACNLRNQGKTVNVYCYYAVINGFCRKDEAQHALRILDDMKNSGISPYVYSYSFIIEGFCRTGELQKGLPLLEEMERSGINHP